MLAHCLRRCSSFNPGLFQCVVFARMHNMVLYILADVVMQPTLPLIDQLYMLYNLNPMPMETLHFD